MAESQSRGRGGAHFDLAQELAKVIGFVEKILGWPQALMCLKVTYLLGGLGLPHEYGHPENAKKGVASVESSIQNNCSKAKGIQSSCRESKRDNATTMVANLLLCALKLATDQELATQDQLYRVQEKLKLEREASLAVCQQGCAVVVLRTCR